VVVFFFFVAVLGALTKGFFGRQLFRFGERLVDRMPVVRSIYTTLKQIVETIFAREGHDSFEQVCLLEYPRRGLWAVAFVTTDTSGEIAEKNSAAGPLVSVFLRRLDPAGNECRGGSETSHLCRIGDSALAAPYGGAESRA